MIEVQTHTAGIGGRHYPAVNVKVYHYPSAGPVMDSLDCSREQADQAIQYAFTSAQERFWHEAAPRIAREVFGEGIEVYSAGRMAGWIIVDGLPSLETWGEELLEDWQTFKNGIEAELDHLASEEYTLDMVESNSWYEPGAEQYNFIDRDGQTVCLSEMKKQARADGYGPVIRE